MCHHRFRSWASEPVPVSPSRYCLERLSTCIMVSLMLGDLYGIHESSLYLIEGQYSDEQGDEHEDCAVQQTVRIERSLAENGIAEGFDDGGQRVDIDHPAITLIL